MGRAGSAVSTERALTLHELRSLREEVWNIEVPYLGKRVALRRCCVVSLGYDVVAICNPWNADLVQVEAAIRRTCPHICIDVLDNELHLTRPPHSKTVAR
jgi:hypothetical protein